MISPPKPTLAATVPRPPRAVQMWWQPSLWAEGMVCWSGKVGSVVLWTRRAEEPLAERRAVGVGAREKISAGCAGRLGGGLAEVGKSLEGGRRWRG